jgi:pSer/pThr/pTyr-binding forkhead associated (FHA) protein/DNA-binding CsgD family transcriptional regulator
MSQRVLCPKCLTDNEDEARCRKCRASLNLAVLDVVQPDGGGRLLLRPRSYTIGRTAEADLLLADRSVSRLHARLDYQLGGYHIQDNSSRHGVYVDSVRVSSARLTHGCAVQIGGVLLRFTEIDPDASTTSVVRSARTRSSTRGVRRVPSEWATETLDQLQLGVILTTGPGRIAFANRCARAILDAGDGLASDGTGLRATQAEATRELRRMLEAEAGGILVLPRASQHPLTIVVTSLAAGLRWGSHGVRAVFVSDPDRAIATTEETLIRLHALTPTEAAVALELLQGRTLEGAAAELGITLQTARTHLKKVFAKTKTRRQSELVLLLLKGVPQLARG